MCRTCVKTAGRTNKLHVGGMGYVGNLRRLAASRKQRLSENALDVEWHMIDALKQTYERSFIRDLEDVFARQEEVVIRNLEQELKQIDVTALFSLPQWQEETNSAVTAHALEIMSAGFSNGFQRIGVEGVDFTSSHPMVRMSIAQIAQNHLSVQRTLSERLGETIQEGLVEGEDLPALTDRVDKLFEDYGTWKPREIAQTAATSGFETGQLRAYQEAGVAGRAWLSQRDSRVRSAHVGVDGQRRPLDEPFDVGGYALRFPGDPLAPPRLTIWCRCSTRPILTA